MAQSKDPLPVMLFETQSDWDNWLAENHLTHKGLRLRIAKKKSEMQSVTYAEALETALCYGWIDSKKEAYDSDTFLQCFTPRNPRSVWSLINREKVETLIATGKMKPRGLVAVEAAKLSGQWEIAYASQKVIKVPEDFEAALDHNPEAKAFFETLNTVNRYAFLYRIQNAKKPETREKNISRFIAMLEKEETFH